VASPAANAHDGGVVAILTIAIVGGLILGAFGGTLSGWFDRRLAVCTAGTLAVCGAAVVVLEVMTDNAIAKNFWPNIVFLAPFAAIPAAFAYLVIHIMAIRFRSSKEARTGQDQP
jgi:uncharacterized membrane protein YadS